MQEKLGELNKPGGEEKRIRSNSMSGQYSDHPNIRVRDDGVGIDKTVLANGHANHFGLTGMRERARAIRAELNIWSREAAGTEVELVIPASIAYPRKF